MKLLLSLFLVLASAGPSFGAGDSAGLRADDPEIEFTVVKSDTLIGLTQRVLVSATAWREVASRNRLANPNRIYPGQVLRIPVRLLCGTPRPAMLVSSAGDVRIDAVALPGSALGDTPIADGQMVQTGPAGSAVIDLGDGSRVRLPPSSLAQIMGSHT